MIRSDADIVELYRVIDLLVMIAFFIVILLGAYTYCSNLRELSKSLFCVYVIKNMLIIEDQLVLSKLLLEVSNPSGNYI